MYSLLHGTAFNFGDGYKMCLLQEFLSFFITDFIYVKLSSLLYDFVMEWKRNVKTRESVAEYIKT